MAKPWAALYAGYCEECGKRFAVGTAVKWNAGHAVVHALCFPELPDPKEYRVQMCTFCWTVHAAGQVGCQ